MSAANETPKTHNFHDQKINDKNTVRMKNDLWKELSETEIENIVKSVLQTIL